MQELKDCQTPSTNSKRSQKVLRSGKLVEISLVEGSFRRIAGVREEADFSGAFILRTVEIRRESGKSLGFYIREGDGWLRKDGIFISRVNLGSMVEVNGLLHVGDEVLKVNNVDVLGLSLDDVVLIMTVVRKLVLTIKVLTSVSLTRTLSARMPRRKASTSSRVLPMRPKSMTYAEKIASKESEENPYEEITLNLPQISASLNLTQPTGTSRACDYNTDRSKEVEEIEMSPLQAPSPSESLVPNQPIAASTPVLPHKLQSSAEVEVHVDVEPIQVNPHEPFKFDDRPASQSDDLVSQDAQHQDKDCDSDDFDDENPPPIPPTPPPLENPPQLSVNSDEHSSLPSQFPPKDDEHLLPVPFYLPPNSDDEHPPPLPLSPPPQKDTPSILLSKPTQDNGEHLPPSPLLQKDGEQLPPILPPLLLKDNDEVEHPPPLPPSPPPQEISEDTGSLQVDEEVIDSKDREENEGGKVDLVEPDKSRDSQTCSGVLVATIRSLNVNSDTNDLGEMENPKIDRVEFVLLVDSNLKVKSSIDPANLGDIESRTFTADLLENQQISITLKCDHFSKSRQVTLFTPATEGKTRKFLLPFKLDNFGKAKINLEYRPMAIAIPRMDPAGYTDDSATFKDYIESNPSSTKLPLVIERCVSVIERYGLHEPYLYHLCSSDAAKNEALVVSLSQMRTETDIEEIVSRISVHAFTGVLKDFFRKLPEPLFMNKLSTSLTEVARMEKMLKIRDFLKEFTNYLPEYVIPTHNLLLDHFRCVCSYSNENGMTVENLSRVFGPLLLTPALTQDSNTSPTTENFADDYRSQSRVITILMQVNDTDELPTTYKV